NEPQYGRRLLVCDGASNLLFTENETNTRRLYGHQNRTQFAKDGFNEYLVHGDRDAVNSQRTGTKAAAHYELSLPAGESVFIRLRLSDAPNCDGAFDDFDRIFAARVQEADDFYATVIPQDLSEDARRVMRQSFAGLLWSKQFYHYVVNQWL